MAILISVGGLALLIGSLVGNKTQFTKEKGNGDGSLIVVRDLVEKDTDSDGVPDWKESLWSTNPNTPNTFPNISDYEYVKEKELLLANTQMSGSYTTGGDPTTTTDAFARDVVTLVSALNASGQLTQENQQAIVTQIQNYIQNHPGSKEYQISDIKVVPSSTATEKSYGTQTTAIITKNKITENDAIALANYGKNIELGDFSTYVAISKKYQNIVDEFLKIATPTGAITAHLDLINAAQGLSDAYEGLSLYETDSLLSLVAYSQLEEKLAIFSLASQSMANYFGQISK